MAPACGLEGFGQMPLQNRVDPFGRLHAMPARGDWMGNRGCLHNDRQQIVSERWTTKAWITCVLEFRGRQRQLMRPGRYTELFFLDEATALAAGHRPCAECRRADYNRFREAFAAGNGLAAPPRAGELDRILHAERTSPRPQAPAQTLPDGAMFAVDQRAWLKLGDSARLWGFDGYGPPESLPEARVTVLTPQSTVAALRAGYVCQTRA
jgi:hypothetical protein